MTDYEKLLSLNPHVGIALLNNENFSRYGRILNSEEFTDLFELLKKMDIPESGNIYVASDSILEAEGRLEKYSDVLYNGKLAQLGFCNGNSNKINCIEFHEGEEFNLSGSSMVLFVGRKEDLAGNRLSTEKLECFYVPEGTVLSFYSGTLHFAPCKVFSSGFRCMVILPRGTNSTIPESEKKNCLFAEKKWLIGHAESRQVREMGAFEGLFGENKEIICIDEAQI